MGNEGLLTPGGRQLEEHTRQLDERLYMPYVERLEYLPVGELSAPLLSLPGGQLHLPGEEPRLPKYLSRDVDRVLVQRVERAARGTSTVVFAVSNGTAGKTRACWEAIQHRRPDGTLALAGWRVWPTLSPIAPDELLESCGELSPQTVVWLDDAEQYLLGSDDKMGDQVAKALRELLLDQRRAPVLIIGTLLARSWGALTRRAAPGERDAYPHARKLLTGQDVRIPDFLTASEIERAQKLPDRVLADAARYARRGDVIQYVAAGPDLRRRVTNADYRSMAVLSALVQFRRIATARSVSLLFLERTSPCYLTDSEKSTLSQSWVAEAIADLTRPGTGGRSVLIPNYPTADGSGQPRYTLDDYLDRQRFSVVTRPGDPARLWAELRREVAPHELRPAAEEAQRRSLLREAALLYVSSHEAGDPTAMPALARMLWEAGRIDEAHRCYEIAIANGDHESLPPARKMLVAAGRRQAALDLIQSTLGTTTREGATQTALTYAEIGDRAAAVSWFRKAARRGDDTSVYVATEMMVEDDRDRLPEAIAWLEELVTTGNTDALAAGATAIAEKNDVDAAVRWLRGLADRGDSDLLLAGARWLFAEGLCEEALTWLDTAAEHGARDVMALGALVLVSCGLPSEALEWARRAAEFDEYAPYIAIADAFREAGLLRRALECYDTAARAGEPLAYQKAVETAADLGYVDEAKAWRNRAVRAKSDVDVGAMCARVAANGKTAEAAQWFFHDADASNPECLSPLIRYLATDRAHMEQAIAWYQTANEVDRSQALCSIASLLARDHNAQNIAADLFEHAGNAGASHAYISTARIWINTNRGHQAVGVLRKAKALGEPQASTYLAIAHASRFEFEIALDNLKESFDRNDFSAAAPVALQVFRHTQSSEHRHNNGQYDLEDTHPPEWATDPPPRTVALDVLTRAIEAGDIDALVCKAQLLASTQRFSEAIEMYLRAIATGEVTDSPRARERSVVNWLGFQLYSPEKPVTAQLAEVCDKAGRSRDFALFQRYGLIPGGTIAEHWTVPLRALQVGFE
ncbi:hypothetical protein [Haloechinothrix halophila]|uniref:hypothetical protein n=1 Tax=Haloechinothrix halophila TaxID=1069073 RepID=UPI00040617DE|nr:hypothetical protein [Haloechinothrix halophila]